MQPKAKQEFAKQNGYLILLDRDENSTYFKVADITLIASDGPHYTDITYRTAADSTETFSFEIPSDIVFDCKIHAETAGVALDLRPACNSELDTSRPSAMPKLMAKVVVRHPHPFG